MKHLALLSLLSVIAVPAVAADWRYLGPAEKEAEATAPSLGYIDMADIERSGALIRFSTFLVNNPPVEEYGITRHEAECGSGKERYLSIKAYMGGELAFEVKPEGDHPLTARAGGARAIAVACGTAPAPTEPVADPYEDAVARIREGRLEPSR